jgi:hypothetical protein
VTHPLSTAYRRRMRSGRSLALVLAAVVMTAAACASHHASLVDMWVHVPADLPPASASWPPYLFEDLAAATAFFVELGLKLQGKGSVEGG